LRRFAEQGSNVSDKPSSTYAPAVFLNEPEVKTAKATKQALADTVKRDPSNIPSRDVLLLAILIVIGL